MKEHEIILFMLESINKDNHDLATRSGMTEEQIKESFNQSQNSIGFIVKNLYDRMKEQGILSPTL
jgi:hypothetical protein